MRVDWPIPPGAEGCASDRSEGGNERLEDGAQLRRRGEPERHHLHAEALRAMAAHRFDLGHGAGRQRLIYRHHLEQLARSHQGSAVHAQDGVEHRNEILGWQRPRGLDGDAAADRRIDHVIGVQRRLEHHPYDIAQFAVDDIQHDLAVGPGSDRSRGARLGLAEEGAGAPLHDPLHRGPFVPRQRLQRGRARPRRPDRRSGWTCLDERTLPIPLGPGLAADHC